MDRHLQTIKPNKVNGMDAEKEIKGCVLGGFLVFVVVVVIVLIITRETGLFYLIPF